jgi:hypothetical protein
MNGMKEKAARRENQKRMTVEGLPRDANDWTEEDWADLHHAIEHIKEKVAARHRNNKRCYYCKKNHAPENWCPEKQAAWRKK